MHFNLVDNLHAVFAVNHIDSKPSSAKASSATDPVKVRLVVCVPVHVNRQVEVHHEGHLLHINTCDKQRGILHIYNQLTA